MKPLTKNKIDSWLYRLYMADQIKDQEYYTAAYLTYMILGWFEPEEFGADKEERRGIHERLRSRLGQIGRKLPEGDLAKEIPGQARMIGPSGLLWVLGPSENPNVTDDE